MAADHSSKKLIHNISKTVVSIKKEWVKKKRAVESDDDDDLQMMYAKKCGRQLLLGHDLDTKVQLYQKKVREAGGVVSARIAMAAARGILLTCSRSILAEFGGHVEINRFWTYSLLHQIKFVQIKVITVKVSTSLLKSIS